MMNIQDLPTEILKKIFANFLPIIGDGSYEKKAKIKQLLDCTEVCKLFNEVIGQSERLMSGIQIRWDETMEPFLTTSRLYRNINIGGVDEIITASTHLFYFLKTQPKISFLRMGYLIKLQALDFWMIIDAVKNSLKELHIKCIVPKHYPVLMPIYIPNLRTINLRYGYLDEGIEKICYISDNSENLVSFRLETEVLLNSDFVAKVEEFLIDCKRLKILSLSGIIMEKIYETSNLFERANFQLEKISFQSYYGSNYQMVPSLDIFLKKQAFLKELELTHLLVTDKLLDTIFGIKTLTKLVLRDPIFQIARNVHHIRSTSIEALRISVFDVGPEDDIEWYTGVCYVIKGCPAARELDLSQVSFSKMVAEHVIEHLKRLETLKVYMDKKIHLINIPSIRTLVLSGSIIEEFNCQHARIALEFIQQNPQLTKIKVLEHYKDHIGLKKLPNVAQGRLEYFKYY